MNKKASQPVKLNFVGMSAIVFGMVIGAGIFNIPQNIASVSNLGPALLSWLVTAVAILLLVATFKTLADRRPDLDAGIYQYGREGWGNYVGFNLAWGYWLSACFANVAYAVMLNDAFGAFIPGMINSGWSQVVFGSVLIWIMYAVVTNGMRTAKNLNNIMCGVKVLAIMSIIVLLALNIHTGMFDLDLWSRVDMSTVGDQIRNTMLITLWCFIGIEGAAMMSSRAKRSKDIGRAGVAGFAFAWVLYVLVTVLCYGLMTRRELAGLDNPSVAYVLRAEIGDWAYYAVIATVIIALLGSWVSWTMICAQVPCEAARVGIMPRSFRRINSQGMPGRSLAVSSVIMQCFLLLVVMAKDVYLAALSITGMMILPAYLFSALYLWRLTGHKGQLGTISRRRNMRFRLTAIACTLSCLWMIYAGGPELLLSTSGFYLCGLAFYVKARRDAGAPRLFSRGERVLLAVLIAGTVATPVMMMWG